MTETVEKEQLVKTAQNNHNLYASSLQGISAAIAYFIITLTYDSQNATKDNVQKGLQS